eukprot:2963103-Amphidinium_carterae.1
MLITYDKRKPTRNRKDDQSEISYLLQQGWTSKHANLNFTDICQRKSPEQLVLNWTRCKKRITKKHVSKSASYLNMSGSHAGHS